MFQVKQSEATAARRRIPILFVSSTDGFTPVTPTSPAAYISVNGATWVATTNAVAVATLAAGQSLAGVYYLELTAAEVANLGWITVNVQATNARQYNAQIQVMAYDPYDVVRIGLTSIPNVAQGNAGALPTGSATGQVTVATNNDKTGYSLTQAFPTNFASMAITAGGAVTAGTVSDKTGYSLTQAFPTNFSALAITAGGAVTTGTVNDKTGYSLATAPPTAAAIATQVWSEALPGAYTSGQAGFKLDAGTATNVWAAGTRTLTAGTNIVLAKGTGITGFNDITTTQVWSEALPGTYTSGQAGFKLNAAGSAADPWSTALPGAYSAGSAGNIIGNMVSNTWSAGTRTLTAGTNIVLAKNTGITGFNDITAQSVWDVLASSVSLTNSIGLQLKTNVDTTVSSRLSAAGYTAPPTTAAITSAIWSESVATSYNTVGTTGNIMHLLGGNTGQTTNNVTATTTTFSVNRNDSDGTFVNQTIVFDGGLLNGVCSNITSWTKVGSYAVVVVEDALPSAPNANSNFYILPQHVQSINDIKNGVWNQARSTASTSGGVPAAGTFGYYLDSQVSTAGGGGGGSATASPSVGPFTVLPSGAGADNIVDLNVGSALPLVLNLQDGSGAPFNASGATVTATVYTAGGSTVTTYTGSIIAGYIGAISVPLSTAVTATSATYTMLVSVVIGTTTTVFGPLKLVVRAI